MKEYNQFKTMSKYKKDEISNIKQKVSKEEVNSSSGEEIEMTPQER